MTIFFNQPWYKKRNGIPHAGGPIAYIRYTTSHNLPPNNSLSNLTQG